MAVVAAASDSSSAQETGENRRHVCGTPFKVVDRPGDSNRDVTSAAAAGIRVTPAGDRRPIGINAPLRRRGSPW
jgi:hypothetical protein